MTEFEASKWDAKRVLDARLREEPDRCPLCKSKIQGTTSLEHDRECINCRTKFRIEDRDDEGRPIPTVAIKTTPLERIKRGIEQHVYHRAAFDALTDEQEDE